MDNNIFFSRIRIECIHLVNFKSVAEGTVEFNCLKNPIEKDINSDILGLYGQNGSGKTTLLEAIELLKYVMMGKQIPTEYGSDIVSQGAKFARVEVRFQIQNSDESLFHVEYGFSIANTDIYEKLDGERPDIVSDLVAFTLVPFPFNVMVMNQNKKKRMERAKPRNTGKRMLVYDEVLSLGGPFGGVNCRYGPIFDTRTKADEVAFVPKAKHQDFFPIDTASALRDMKKYKDRALLNSQSFIFSDDVMSLIIEHGDEDLTDYQKLIIYLKMYALNNIYVLTTSTDDVIPIYSASRRFDIRKIDSSLTGDKEFYDDLMLALRGLNFMLKKLIPELTLEAVRQADVDERGEVLASDNIEKTIKIYSVRDKVRIPLAAESTGIIRMVSALGLLACAMTNDSVIVAIDEIDAGVYEYLLGEVLSVFQDYGCGQLVFTCHNLRPLQILRRKFLCFTTTNPNNRYIKVKNIRNNKDLREIYLEEIINGGQDENLYESSNYGAIASAFQKAGEELEEES